MTIKEGDTLPEVTLHHMTEKGPTPITSSELFGGKKTVLFAVPGAFTPGCSMQHLPGFVTNSQEILDKGADQIVCLSVNDAFVMFQWGKQQEAKNVFLLPDGSGEFTRKMGMLVDKSNLGFGMRSWRYSMLVDNCKVEKIFVESGFSDNCPSDPFEVSDADTMLAYLKGDKPSGVSKPVKAFIG
jgi:peroxiredoxin